MADAISYPLRPILPPGIHDGTDAPEGPDPHSIEAEIDAHLEQLRAPLPPPTRFTPLDALVIAALKNPHSRPIMERGMEMAADRNCPWDPWYEPSPPPIVESVELVPFVPPKPMETQTVSSRNPYTFIDSTRHDPQRKYWTSLKATPDFELPYSEMYQKLQLVCDIWQRNTLSFESFPFSDAKQALMTPPNPKIPPTKEQSARRFCQSLVYTAAGYIKGIDPRAVELKRDKCHSHPRVPKNSFFHSLPGLFKAYLEKHPHFRARLIGTQSPLPAPIIPRPAPSAAAGTIVMAAPPSEVPTPMKKRKSFASNPYYFTDSTPPDLSRKYWTSLSTTSKLDFVQIDLYRKLELICELWQKNTFTYEDFPYEAAKAELQNPSNSKIRKTNQQSVRRLCRTVAYTAAGYVKGVDPREVELGRGSSTTRLPTRSMIQCVPLLFNIFMERHPHLKASLLSTPGALPAPAKRQRTAPSAAAGAAGV
ncbi:MAG: hypothetical protein SP1CHLAM54_08910 [Chlamydiia bacterium]|nr:hypothetical protein [Chlamydiia bacterium]MCH9615797.1 hypothetical protein [Chlamydiia bacterium]MCH9628800.1 hypothetical protein [Chlamydiia bacterium]